MAEENAEKTAPKTPGKLTINEMGILVDSATGQAIMTNAPPKPNDSALKKDSEPIKFKSYSKYEVKPDTFFKIDFGIAPLDDRWIVINKEDVDVTDNAELHWVKFKMWTYKEELEWKSKCMEYDGIKRFHFMNNDKLNEMKIRYLIQDWSFAEKDANLKLLHVNGYLSDEGYKMICSLYPTIIRHITEVMNSILEYNA